MGNDMETPARILSLADLPALRDRLSDFKIVLATGCFDLLHRGHVHFLEEAGRQGDLLVVGVNSDSSVRAIKGDSRPISNERDRAILIAAMRFVEAVFLYDDQAADDCIRALRPEVFVTGAESYDLYPTEVSAAEQIGAVVHVIDRIASPSTTSLLDRVRDEPVAPGEVAP